MVLDIKYLQEFSEAFFEENELADCYFVDAKIQGSRVEVFIDKDGGISFDTCKKLSRKIEAVLDESKVIGEAYTLEVSSPGIGTPLKMPRQYINNINRDIEVETINSKLKGKLIFADESVVKVELEETVLEGKKKKKILVAHEVSYSDIKVAKIKVSFK